MKELNDQKESDLHVKTHRSGCRGAMNLGESRIKETNDTAFIEVQRGDKSGRSRRVIAAAMLVIKTTKCPLVLEKECGDVLISGFFMWGHELINSIFKSC